MAKHESFLVNHDVGDSIHSVEVLIKKHEDFENSLAAQEMKMKALDEFATKLMEGQHYAAEDVGDRRAQLLKRSAQLLEKSGLRKTMLEDSLKFQQFEHECYETKEWIKEKHQVATDGSYLDPVNINDKIQKHENFKQELMANKSRIDEVFKSGNDLIDSGHVQSHSIKEETSEIKKLWANLFKASEMKGVLLGEEGQLQQHNRDTEDLEMWLSKIEGQLLSQDYGKDLTSVQNLQKKHAVLEADVGALKDRMDGVRIAAQHFAQARHFDNDNIQAKYKALEARYNNLMKTMCKRRLRLKDSLDVQQLFRDVEDEEAWIRQRKPIFNSTNRGNQPMIAPFSINFKTYLLKAFGAGA